MKTPSKEELEKLVMEHVRPAEEFTPTASYDPDGDCIEFLAKPDPFYAERVDDLVTVYYSQDTKEIIGSLIKGVSRFCKKVMEQFPGLKIEIIDGRMKLEHIFRARLWSSRRDPTSMATITYQKLIEVAEESDIDVETDDLCHA